MCCCGLVSFSCLLSVCVCVCAMSLLTSRGTGALSLLGPAGTLQSSDQFHRVRAAAAMALAETTAHEAYSHGNTTALYRECDKLVRPVRWREAECECEWVNKVNERKRETATSTERARIKRCAE